MLVQCGAITRIERRQRTRGQHLFVVFVHHRQKPKLSFLPVKTSRSFIIPARILVLTVPKGAPSLAAISDCVSPSKYASTKGRFCSSGSSDSAEVTRARCSERKVSEAASETSSEASRTEAWATRSRAPKLLSRSIALLRASVTSQVNG